MGISLLRIHAGMLLLVVLAACDWSSDDQQFNQSQKYFFLESLQQVDLGGRELRAISRDQAAVTQALTRLDDGLKLAFQVERKFLDELDIRLGKNFERYFINGVENYRIGIEAGDEQQQRKGLQQLAAWATFWNREQAAILARLKPE